MGRMPCVAPLSRLLGEGQFALLLLAAAVAAVACSVATTPPMQPSATARTRAQAEWALPSALAGGIGQGHGHPCLALGMRCTRSSSLDWLRLRGGAQVAAVAAPVAQQPALGTGGWMPDMELLQIMHDLLEKTLQAGEVERAHGEQGLKQLQQRSGFLPALFTVVGTGAVRIEVRLAAALYTKNFLRAHWNEEAGGRQRLAGGVQTIELDAENRIVERRGDAKEDLDEASDISVSDSPEGWRTQVERRGGRAEAGGLQISEADRAFVREMLLPSYLAAAATEALRKPLGECVAVVAADNFLEKMPGLLPAIVARLDYAAHPLSEVQTRMHAH